MRVTTMTPHARTRVRRNSSTLSFRLSSSWFLHVRPNSEDDPNQTDNGNNRIVSILGGSATVNVKDMSSQLNCPEDQRDYNEHDSEVKHHFVHDLSRLFSTGLRSKKYLKKPAHAQGEL